QPFEGNWWDLRRSARSLNELIGSPLPMLGEGLGVRANARGTTRLSLRIIAVSPRSNFMPDESTPTDGEETTTDDTTNESTTDETTNESTTDETTNESTTDETTNE